MHNQKIVLIISAIVGVIATFLPYMKSWFNSVSLMDTQDGTGYIIIVAFVISLIVALLGDHKKAIKKGHLAGTIIPGVIPGVLLLLFVLSVSNDSLVNSLSNFEIGFYLVIIASLAILILGLSVNEDNSIKSTSVQVDKFFCSGCGKQYSNNSSGEYYEECGSKL